MTDWSCGRCKLVARRFDNRCKPCPSCGGHMTRGRRRGYRRDPRADERHAWESRPEAVRRTLDWRRAE